LWVIPAGGTPHSLGVLHARGGTALTLSRDNRARIAAGAVLAVTVEPIGGSPSGLPTGPVVAKGALSPV
jgi:anti-sigma-K factor RskA